MTLILLSLGLILLAAVVAIVPISDPRSRTTLSVAILFAASCLGLLSCLGVLIGQPAETFNASWAMPFGSLALRLDALAAFFLVPIFGLGVLTALYGIRYLHHATEEKNSGLLGVVSTLFLEAWFSSCWRPTACFSWWHGS